MATETNRWGLAVDEKQPHLGGYVPGGDPESFYPILWEWLVSEQGVQSVIDVGCGEGQALDHYHELGCTVLGIDGVTQAHAAIIQHDYAAGAWPMDVHVERADLVWSCEFVEHVEERYVPNFLATFALAELVLMTHALPGQPGHHHVNCQPPDYWVGALATIGYALDEGLTQRTRELAGHGYYRLTGLAFRRV